MVNYHCKYKIGQKFNKWTIIDFEKGLYKCQCDCGNISFVRGISLRKSESTRCKDCSHKIRGYSVVKENFLRIKHGIYGEYLKGAKRRDIEFKLSFDEVINFVEQNCYYCGQIPNQVTTVNIKVYDRSAYKFNGIDRMDNSVGYIVSNCVPCCNICNYSKRMLPQAMWFEWIEKVYLNLKRKNLIKND